MRDTEDEVSRLGRIAYEAFQRANDAHGVRAGSIEIGELPYDRLEPCCKNIWDCVAEAIYVEVAP